MVSDHMNYLTFEDPGAVNLVRRALKLAEAGDLYGAAETASVDLSHAAVVSEGLRKGMRYSIGAEVDNDPRARPDAQNIVDAMRPDGIIRSVHFLTIQHPEKGPEWPWPFDNPEFVSLYDEVGTERTWELYMAALLEAIEKLPGHIVGHFYVPASFGHWPDAKKLEEYENQLIDVVAAKGMAIELNTRFLYRDNPPDQKKKFLEANLRLLKKAKAKGVGIAVGSDAHSPKDQGAAFDQALELLDKADVNELIFPVAGRLARVALRATKEHLEKRAALTEVPVPGSSISGYSRAELVSMNGGELPAETPVEKPKTRKSARTTSPKERLPKATPQRVTQSPVKAAKVEKTRPAPKAPPRPTKARGKTAKRAQIPVKKGKRSSVSTVGRSAKKAARKATPSQRRLGARARKTASKPAKKSSSKNVSAPKKRVGKIAKPAIKKSTVKKSANKKATPKKNTVKKSTLKKATTKKSTPKKSAIKSAKRPAKKAAAKKPSTKRR
ncbi:MAG: PHP domain-containing protein [Candidatus Eremiobacteraeota bacterium]|nr:PHP domain-containing protein [Candidatus Eremiobacteraeota bacterium]